MKFEKEKFDISAGGSPVYLTYERKFVGRFKYVQPSRTAAHFASFLRRHFTVEEYFARREAGEAPLTILESKGYLLPHVRKMVKDAGYPVTPAGFKQMIADQCARRVLETTPVTAHGLKNVYPSASLAEREVFAKQINGPVAP